VVLNDVIIQEYETKIQHKEEKMENEIIRKKDKAESNVEELETQLQNELNNEKEIRAKFQAENIELESVIDKYKSQYEAQIALLTAENEALTSKAATLESEKIELEDKLQGPGNESIYGSEVSKETEDQGEMEKLREEIKEVKEALRNSKDRFEKT